MNFTKQLMNKSAYFKNKIYYEIDLNDLYKFHVKHRINYKLMFDYLFNFKGRYFLGSYYLERKKDAQQYVDWLDSLIIMEKLIK